MVVEKNLVSKEINAETISDYAVQALLEEVRLTPKPGLVDSDNRGCHNDLTLSLMELSAHTLKSTFKEMAEAVKGKSPSQEVREILAAIGREGERRMLVATKGVNTHKGAIWTLGLITGASAMLLSNPGTFEITTQKILSMAGAIAEFEDRYMPVLYTNGEKARRKYAIRSAREEAILGFPTLQNVAIPSFDKYTNEDEAIQGINVLISLMASTDDTCILNRSNMEVLNQVKILSKDLIDNGGIGLPENGVKFKMLENFIIENWISPGGSADLLAATIYLKKITDNY